MNELKRPKPIRKPARFVDQTGLSRIICMSTSALGVRASRTTHETPTATATASSPIVRTEVQPH